MADDSTFDVLIATLDRVVFEGKAKSLILPGENGTFEVLPYHKKLLSRLKQGPLVLDGTTYPIRGGVVKVSPSDVTVIVEEAR
jgi:F-type H+-transporting ATPase subunit epsilon